MKRAPDGYLFESYTDMGGAYTSRRLVAEATAAGVDLRVVGIHDSHAARGAAHHAGAPLPRRAFGINRYKWGRVTRLLNGCVGRSYNPYDAHATYINKFDQLESLSSDQFRKPDYLLSTAMLDASILERRFAYPFVAKGLESSQGKEIFLIGNGDDLRNLRARFPADKEWLFQEFISGSAGRDMRFLVIRGTIAAGMARTARDDFRANVALGATVEALAPTPGIERIARDLWRQSGLDYFGLDLLHGTEQPYFCEINVMPGLEGIEKATGVNAARAIIDLIVTDHADDLPRS